MHRLVISGAVFLVRILLHQLKRLVLLVALVVQGLHVCDILFVV